MQLKEIRERIYSALMTALPEEGDPGWNDIIKIQSTVQRVFHDEHKKMCNEQNPYSMSYAFDYVSNELTLYLVPKTIELNISLSVEKEEEIND